MADAEADLSDNLSTCSNIDADLQLNIISSDKLSVCVAQVYSFIGY